MVTVRPGTPGVRARRVLVLASVGTGLDAMRVAAASAQREDFDAITVFEGDPGAWGSAMYAALRASHPVSFTLLRVAAAAEGGVVSLDDGGGPASRVGALDFSQWLALHATRADDVTCVLDVRGLEYEVCTRMLMDGTLCLCDRLSVRWYQWAGHPDPRPNVRHFGLSTDAVSEWAGGAECGAGAARGAACRAEPGAAVPEERTHASRLYGRLPRIVAAARGTCGGDGGGGPRLG